MEAKSETLTSSSKKSWLKVGSSFSKVKEQKKENKKADKEKKRDKKRKDKKEKKDKKLAEQHKKNKAADAQSKVLPELSLPIYANGHNYTYSVMLDSTRAHKELYQKRSGVQCYHTLPLYERLCDQISEPHLRVKLRVILGFNQKSHKSR